MVMEKHGTSSSNLAYRGILGTGRAYPCMVVEVCTSDGTVRLEGEEKLVLSILHSFSYEIEYRLSL